MKKKDLRVIRTRKMIIAAFIKLGSDKAYDEITIQNIADEAMINRATFYAHFKDKQDLYDYILDFSLEAFTAILDTEKLIAGNSLKIKKLEKLLTKVFQLIRENKLFYQTVTEGDTSNDFREKIVHLLNKKYKEIFQKMKITQNDIEVPKDFIINYMTFVFIGTVQWWVKSDDSFPPQHMAELVIKLVGNAHLTVLGIDIDRN